MIRASSVRSTAIAAALVATSLVAAPAARADDTVEYVVKAGDTCYRIAATELGDRSKLPVLHRYNPQLGRLPHHLVAGQVLRLPVDDRSADAHLTGASGLVRFRRPAQAVWDAARRGMELFRAWRVGAEDRSSAEVTFRDDDRLQLRENTIVIIYGPDRSAARVSPTEAVLEQGTLRSRLGELSPTVRVTTPTAVATLGRGSALVGVVDGQETSTIANHDGGAIPVAGRGRAGGRVRVAAGMGSRVVRGRRPEPPRPLPPPPAWTSTGPARFAVPGADGAIVSAAWTPVTKAARYRVEILAPSGTIVGAAEVPAGVTRFELVRVPVGSYQARVASIDVDHLEGRPGPLLAIEVVAVAIRPPGAAPGLGSVAATPAPPATAATTTTATTGPAIATATATASSDGEPRIDLPGPPPRPLLVARGATVGGPGLACATGGEAPAVAHLLALGTTVVHCTLTGDAGEPPRPIAPFTVDVVGVSATPRGGAPAIAIAAEQSRTVAIALSSVAPLGDDWRVLAAPGLTVERTTVLGGELTLSLRAGRAAPPVSRLLIVDAAGGPPLTSVAVTVARPAARPAADRARR
jgi:hypothetical protein